VRGPGPRRGRDRSARVSPARVARVLSAGVVAAALPWTWYAVRDLPWGAVVEVPAVGLPVLAVTVAAVAGWQARRRRSLPAAVLALSTLALGLTATLGPWLPRDAGSVAGRGVTVLAANTDGDLASGPALLGARADVLIVAELAEDLVDDLTVAYPHRYVRVHPEDDPDLGVFSRYPLRLLEPVGPDLPGARLQVAGPDGAFVLYGLHVPRPWFSGASSSRYQATAPEHRRLVKAVNEKVRTERLPVVLAGDLNSVDRERDYRTALRTGLVDAMRDAPGGPTSVGKWLALLGRIDHILVSVGWCGDEARRLPLPGSSHRGVLATVGPCAAVP